MPPRGIVRAVRATRAPVCAILSPEGIRNHETPVTFRNRIVTGVYSHLSEV